MIKDAKTSNSPDTVKAIVGETIVGVIADYNSAWWLIVQSGHAFVFTPSGSFWVEPPAAVRALIEKRQKDLGTWMDETRRLMAIDQVLPTVAPALSLAKETIE